jgi:hypothetical protein
MNGRQDYEMNLEREMNRNRSEAELDELEIYE